MLKVNIGEKEFKLRFGYRVLCETDLLKRVQGISVVRDDNEDAMKTMVQTVAELFLAGVQKYHTEYQYVDDTEKKEKLLSVYDLLDDYEDEGTEDNPQDGAELFEKMSGELMKNGFLSAITKRGAKAAEEQDATKLPQDHRKKK